MKKDPFIKRIVKAIKDPHFVANAPNEKTNSVVFYMILLVLIISIPTSIIRGVIISNEMDNLFQAVENPDFPDFQLTDGKFSIDSDQPIIIEQGKQLKVIIDVNGNSTINDLVGYEAGYLLTDTTAVITMKGQSPAYYNLDAFKNIDFNKTMFVTQLELITKVSLFVAPLVILLISIFTTFFRSLMLLLLASILKRMLRLEDIKSSGLYKVVIYSMTLGVILYQLITLIPLFLPSLLSPEIVASLAPILLFYLPSSTIMSRALRLIKVDQDINKLNKRKLDQ